MTPVERQLLEKIERNVSKISEDQAYLRGRLEEIHSRTSEIPAIVLKSEIQKKSLFWMWLIVVLITVFHAPAVVAAVLAIIP